MSASLIGRLWSSAFRRTTTAVSTSLAQRQSCRLRGLSRVRWQLQLFAPTLRVALSEIGEQGVTELGAENIDAHVCCLLCVCRTPSVVCFLQEVRRSRNRWKAANTNFDLRRS